MKYGILALFVVYCVFALSCNNESSLIIDALDVEVDNPDAMDSDEGNNNTTDKSNNEDILSDNSDDEEDGDKMPEPCVDEADCINQAPLCDVCVAGTMKCENDNLYICQKNTEQCLVWQMQENCASRGKWCDNVTKSCISCEETCEPGTKKCTDTGIVECLHDPHGCAVWNPVQKCGSDQHCDESALACVSGCTSVCNANETRCDGNRILACKRAPTGCMAWEVVRICDDGQICVGDGRCERACGEDCQPFSIIVVPDPQNYTASSKGIYKQQMQWIADNKDKENIRFVLHLGDMTDGNRKVHYERAIAAHNILAEAGIPCAPSTGNHDYKAGDSGIDFVCRSRSLFGNYFNDAYFRTRYEDSSWFHGYTMRDNMYATFNVGHIRFAVVALEFFPRKDVLCWAEKLLSTELKDHYVILTTHGYLSKGATENAGKYTSGSNGDVASGALGAEIYRELVARHSNIIMVVSGHVSGAEHRFRQGNTGNSVMEMLVDYQSEKPCTSSSCRSSGCGTTYDAGNGWLRQLKIDPVNQWNSDGSLKDNVTATTFSVLENYQLGQVMFCSDFNTSSDKNYYDNQSTKSDHAFTFGIDFSTPRHYQYSANGDISFIDRNINELVNDATDGEQYAPSIAMNRKTGSFVGVWEDDADKDGFHQIMVRGFCAGGCQEFAQFAVSVSSGTQANPDVAMDKDGNFVVVWEESRDNDADIYMRGFDNKGHARFDRIKVNSKSEGNQILPAIAMDPDGDFAVTWQDQRLGDSHPQIWIRGFNPDGTQKFMDRNVLDNDDGLRRKPDIGMAADGSFVVTWEDDSESNGVTQIIAKGFSGDGTDRLPVFTVNDVATGQQRNPAVSMNESGTFYIVFEDDSDGNKKYLIIAKGYDKDGMVIQKDTTLSGSGENASDPVVCVDTHGKAIFGWTANALNHGDIQKRILTAPGKLKSEAVAHRYKTGTQKSPAIACSADGAYVLSYLDDNKGRGSFDVFAHGYNE